MAYHGGNSDREEGILLRWFSAFVWAVLTVAVTFGIAFIDMLHFGEDRFTEQGLTEISETCFLVMTVLCYLRAAVRHDNRFELLIAGFVLCLCIREQDYFFDKLHHGSWLWFVLTAAAVFIVLSLRRGWQRLLADARSALSNRYFIWMFAGVIVVLTFSRCFGSGVFWHDNLGGAYVRVANRAAEEVTELWGYVQMFSGGLFTALTCGRSGRR